MTISRSNGIEEHKITSKIGGCLVTTRRTTRTKTKSGIEDPLHKGLLKAESSYPPTSCQDSIVLMQLSLGHLVYKSLSGLFYCQWTRLKHQIIRLTLQSSLVLHRATCKPLYQGSLRFHSALATPSSHSDMRQICLPTNGERP
jgi:hypothetical protein